MNTFRDSLCPSCGRFLVTDRPVGDQRPPGVPWGLIAGSAMLVTVGATLFGGWCEVQTYQKHAQRAQAGVDTRMLQVVGEKWEFDHAECPNPQQLRDARELSEYGKLSDPWGTPYAIECGRDRSVEARSAGPDRKLFTDDDIVSANTKSMVQR